MNNLYLKFVKNGTMKNILIIGSRGFIGKELKKYLCEKGYSVWGADVINDYTENNHYFIIDATNSNFHNLFENNKFDLCINCSGAASVPDSLENPMRDYNLNTVNVFKLLDAIKMYTPMCKFINLSSAAVYGNPNKLPITESLMNSPVSPYGIHKFMSEQICSEYHTFFNIPTCSLRIFSAYGEGLKKQLFWDLYKKTAYNKEIILFGTGEESRDFIYIKDLIQAIYRVAKNGDFKGDVINVANGREVFIKNCVAMFYGFFDKKIVYEFSGKGRKGDPNNWVADISILKKLGYQQKYELTDGLYNFYKWIKETERK